MRMRGSCTIHEEDFQALDDEDRLQAAVERADERGPSLHERTYPINATIPLSLTRSTITLQRSFVRCRPVHLLFIWQGDKLCSALSPAIQRYLDSLRLCGLPSLPTGLTLNMLGRNASTLARPTHSGIRFCGLALITREAILWRSWWIWSGGGTGRAKEIVIGIGNTRCKACWRPPRSLFKSSTV